MKTRESGMPPDAVWQTFFDVERILDVLELSQEVGDLLEFGCGYGTFTLPAARRIRGTLHSLEIDPEMLATTRAKAEALGIHNLDLRQRDFVAAGTGLAVGAVDYVMLFNILHAVERMAMLQEAWQVLRPDGKLAVIHWNYDPSTRRGPSMAIRPQPENCRQWAEQVGFRAQSTKPIDLPPYHYGWLFHRPQSEFKLTASNLAGQPRASACPSPDRLRRPIR